MTSSTFTLRNCNPRILQWYVSVLGYVRTLIIKSLLPNVHTEIRFVWHSLLIYIWIGSDNTRKGTRYGEIGQHNDGTIAKIEDRFQQLPHWHIGCCQACGCLDSILQVLAARCDLEYYDESPDSYSSNDIKVDHIFLPKNLKYYYVKFLYSRRAKCLNTHMPKSLNMTTWIHQYYSHPSNVAQTNSYSMFNINIRCKCRETTLLKS